MRVHSLVMGALLASAIGLAIFAASQRAGVGVATIPTPTATVQKATEARRPAWTQAEEQYIRQVWPIHGDVQRHTMRMSLGQIFYKTQGLSGAELNARMKDALASYQAAEKQLRATEPPPSLRAQHQSYLSAIGLLRESAVEALKMFADGRDDHLVAAYPKSQEASNRIREVGGKFWPHEFPPH